MEAAPIQEALREFGPRCATSIARLAKLAWHSATSLRVYGPLISITLLLQNMCFGASCPKATSISGHEAAGFILASGPQDLRD